MKERNDIPKDTDNPDTPHAPEPPAEPDEKPGTDKDKTPPIEIRQVPMDGVCGGY